MNRKRRMGRRLAAFACAVACLVLCCGWPARAAGFVIPEAVRAAPGKDFVIPEMEVTADGSELEIKEPGQLYAQSAVLMDADSGRILFAKDGQVERPMASTTKIMTCILTLEHADLDAQAEVSGKAASQPEVHLGVRAGQKFRVGDLLYSLMLESHNDAAVVLAEYVGGSTEEFARMMNDKAKEIGCEHTYFITPNGLDSQNDEGTHHTTAEDLARIMKYCIMDSSKAGEFLEITRTDSYAFTDFEGKSSYSCNNHNSFLKMMDGALSGKTGFTNGAGYCYVGALKQDDRVFIVALLACGWPNHKTYKWRDTRELMEYGLSSFEYVELTERPDLRPIVVHDGIASDNQPDTQAKVEVEMEDGLEGYKALLRKDQRIEMRAEVEEALTAPVEKGSVVGKVQYFCDGNLLCETEIKTCESIRERTFSWCLGWIFRKIAC